MNTGGTYNTMEHIMIFDEVCVAAAADRFVAGVICTKLTRTRVIYIYYKKKRKPTSGPLRVPTAFTPYGLDTFR